MPRRTLAELKAAPPKLTAEQRAQLLAMADDEIDAAADCDDENPTWSADELEKAAFARTVRKLREKLGLTQVAFADRYKIGRPRLKDWERARFKPDSVSAAYIAVIAHDPEGTLKALAAASPPARKKRSAGRLSAA